MIFSSEVRDVKVSSLWYQAVIGCQSGHDGSEYEQLMFDGQMIMQFHHWDAHEHSTFRQFRVSTLW
jgi:catechol-2,3-dioxygenase